MKRMVMPMTQHERDLACIKAFRLMDDDFMSAVFADSPECAALVLNIILDRQDIEVLSVKTQYVVHSVEGHSVRMDMLARGSDGVLFNVEIQRADRGAARKRARYYSGILDAVSLKKGGDYEELPETYIIFITEKDVLGRGKAVYRIDRMIDGDEPFGDGAHIVFVNGAFRGDTPIGQLMHDFNCTNVEEFCHPALRQRTRYFKEDTEGVGSMCRMMEEMRNEVALESKIATWIDDAKKMMERFHVSREDAVDTFEIPAEYRTTVLEALK